MADHLVIRDNVNCAVGDALEESWIESLPHGERNALRALWRFLRGESLTASAHAEKICHKRLARVLARITEGSEKEKDKRKLLVEAVRRVRGKTEKAKAANHPRPGALSAAIALSEKAQKLIDDFTGVIHPGRPGIAFEKLHRAVIDCLDKSPAKGMYPCNAPDLGRRAFLRMMRSRLAQSAREIVIADVGDATTQTLDGRSIVPIASFDRIEIDSHAIDLRARVEIEVGGKIVQKDVEQLWITVAIDVVSRAIVAWVLHFSRSPSTDDILDLFSLLIAPWARSAFPYTGLSYFPGAGMPNSVPKAGCTLRPIELAMDSASFQANERVIWSCCRALGAIIHLGIPASPEVRGIIEAFFKTFETRFIRKLPGSFIPPSQLGDEPTPSSVQGAKPMLTSHEVLWEIIEYCITRYNSTPHPGNGNLSPLERIERDETSEVWPPVRMPFKATVDTLLSGSASVRITRRESPQVHFLYARYSSPELAMLSAYFGRPLRATYRRDDVSVLYLSTDDGRPLATLRACRPWGGVPHSEKMRKRVSQWMRSNKVDARTMDCAVTAYIEAHSRQAEISHLVQSEDSASRTRAQSKALPAGRNWLSSWAGVVPKP